MLIHLLFFSCLDMSNSLPPHELQQARLPCPLPSTGACSNSCPLSQWCHPTISPSVFPSPPAFNLSQHQGLFKWVISLHQVAKVFELQLQHQSIQWTESIQAWFPLGLIGLISLLSRGLSRVFSNITVQKHQFFLALYKRRDPLGGRIEFQTWFFTWIIVLNLKLITF